jgi:hypothetical protein
MNFKQKRSNEDLVDGDRARNRERKARLNICCKMLLAQAKSKNRIIGICESQSIANIVYERHGVNFSDGRRIQIYRYPRENS